MNTSYNSYRYKSGYGSGRRRRNGPHRYFSFLLSALLVCALVMSLYQLAGAATGKATPMPRTIFDNTGISDGGGKQQDNTADPSPSADPGEINYVEHDGNIHGGYLAVVNSSYACAFPDESQLVTIFEHKTSHYFVGGVSMLVDPTIMDPLNDMMEDFYLNTGNETLNVISSYRTLQEQQELYNESISEHGEEHTTKFQAVPGYSEHHTGLVVDLGIYYEDTGLTDWFDGTGDTKWILDNCWKYGFVQRYETSKQNITGISDEPWHFRYVGIPHSYYMHENNLCLEEYVELLRNYPYSGQHLNFTCEGHNYEIYFCSGDSYYTPIGVADYSVSGNNIDGFIITMLLS